jgi:hypothetical protein
MLDQLGYAYAPILKYDDNDDGTVTVFGKATDETLDVDQQICDNLWLKDAMPDWFTSGGNIREMHSSVAAGVATDYEEKSDGHYITAKIVDEQSVKKIKHGVLKGFSIGIRSPRVIRDNKAPGGRIVGGQIVEVSVVDRPANPSAKMTLSKSVDSVLEFDELVAKRVEFPADGGVVKGGSVIPTPSELASSVWAAKSVEPETPIDEAAPVIADEPEADVVETPVDAPVEAVEAPVEAAEAVEPVSAEVEIVEAAKSLIATLNKFDQGKYDAALGAIADLIIVEANEMKEGSDERDSIKELLRAAKHLACWYEGEAENGEVPGVMPEVSADADGEDLYLAAKTVTVDDAQVEGIVSKAIASAKAAVTEEVTNLVSALEAEQAKSAQLEQSLDEALSKAATGGPKRTIATKTGVDNNELLSKAAAFRLKARTSADPVLAQGYKDLASDLEAKARKEN